MDRYSTRLFLRGSFLRFYKYIMCLVLSRKGLCLVAHSDPFTIVTRWVGWFHFFERECGQGIELAARSGVAWSNSYYGSALDIWFINQRFIWMELSFKVKKITKPTSLDAISAPIQDDQISRRPSSTEFRSSRNQQASIFQDIFHTGNPVQNQYLTKSPQQTNL